MSIFAKPISQLTTEDLKLLRDEGAVENVRLEFKSEVPKKEETLKKLSSFANTFGGYLIVGAQADSSDGRLNALPGVEEQSSYKQKVVQWCFDAVSPPLPIEVSDAIVAPDNPDGFCYVISVQESDLAPHFLNGRRGVWVRSDEFSQRYEPNLANENELRHLLERRRLVRERLDSLKDRSRRRSTRLLGHLKRSAMLVEVSVSPRFPVRHLCSHRELAVALESVKIPWRQSSFPYHPAAVSQHESLLYSVGAEGEEKISIEATLWGTLFYGLRIESREIKARNHALREDQRFLTITTWELTGHLMLFLRHASEALAKIGYAGPLRVDFTFGGIMDLRIASPAGGGQYRFDTGANLDDDFTVSIDCSTKDLAQHDGVIELALPGILFGMNGAYEASSDASIQELMDGGRKYAFWDR